MDYRKSIIDNLITYFRKDGRYHLLVMDSGFGAIDKMRDEMPHRITNMGIAEQGAVGIAAGMAISGMIPIIYSVPVFLCYRALEQIRNDISIPGNNVKLIGSGCDNYFSFLGTCHTCGDDDIKLMELIGVKVYNPYETDLRWARRFDTLLHKWVTSPLPGYVRV